MRTPVHSQNQHPRGSGVECSGQRAEVSALVIECSGYRGNFVTVAGVVDVGPVALGRPPVTAGKGEEEEDERAHHHDSAAEVERQVVGLRVVEEPPWRAAKGEQTFRPTQGSVAQVVRFDGQIIIIIIIIIEDGYQRTSTHHGCKSSFVLAAPQ